METIKLLLVDDSEIHLEGLKSVLRPYEKLQIIGEAYTVDETKSMLKHHTPDVILLDISLEEEADGLELAEYLRRSYPKIAVVILSHYKEVRFIIRALQARVRAYLAKDTKPSEVVHTIEAAMGGKGVFFGDTISYSTLLVALGGEEYLESGKPHGLSEQEVNVLKSLAKGNSSKQVAEELRVNVTTVESYKERIKNKFGCNTVVEMVVYAIRIGILTV